MAEEVNSLCKTGDNDGFSALQGFDQTATQLPPVACWAPCAHHGDPDSFWKVALEKQPVRAVNG